MEGSVVDLPSRFVASVLIVLDAACCGGNTREGGGFGQPRRVSVLVAERGFEPSRLVLRKGVPAELVITRTIDDTCAREIVIDESGDDVASPLHTAVTISFTPEESGEIRYGCAIGKMFGGYLSSSSRQRAPFYDPPS
jgi:hypothetical protein